MRAFFVAAVAVFAAAPAWADEVFFAPGSAHVSLSRKALVADEDAELVVDPEWLNARFGARLVSNPSGTSTLKQPMALGAEYTVRDARGGQHRVRVTEPAEGSLKVELLTTKSAAIEPGEFVNVKTVVNGQPAASAFRPMVLKCNGKYRIDQARGEWMTSEGQLMLGGSMSFWGPGVASADGKTISFKWARGALVWEVTYERSEKQAELAQAR